MKYDDLSIRMKENYEDRTRYSLPRRTYTILRLDGKSFHTYTKGLKKPFDHGLMEDMDAAIIAMLPEIQGAVFAYTQSDEISILLTDFATPKTDAWFDANIQKMTSVAASIMTAEFNKYRMWRNYIVRETCGRGIDFTMFPLAHFDCRCFTIPDRTEVMNYFRWRQIDCIKNSTSMAALAHYSHKNLQNKNTSEKHEMLHAKGINWATDFTDGEKNGRVIVKERYQATATVPDGTSFKVVPELVERHRWVSKGAWEFLKDNGLLLNQIPIYT